MPIDRKTTNDATAGTYWFLAACLLSGCRQDTLVDGPDREPPPAHFVEVTADLGFDDSTPAWPDGHFFTPEVGSGGIALFDFDNDGDLDIYHVVRSRSDDYPQIIENAAPNRLYQQQANGAFVDVTEQSGLADPGFGVGVAVGDVENDGDLDVYVCNYGPDRFYRNNGDGSFTENTAASGLAYENPWTTSAGFFDYDRDGDLDLYVCRFGRYEPQRVCRQPTGKRDYCGPASFDGLSDTLFRNDGNGRFTDVTKPAGIDVPLRAWTLAVGSTQIKAVSFTPVHLSPSSPGFLV